SVLENLQSEGVVWVGSAIHNHDAERVSPRSLVDRADQKRARWHGLSIGNGNGRLGCPRPSNAHDVGLLSAIVEIFEQRVRKVAIRQVRPVGRLKLSKAGHQLGSSQRPHFGLSNESRIRSTHAFDGLYAT